jgi:hypothetical protein
VDDVERWHSTSVQHDAISVVMVRMCTARSSATAARRMIDGVHAVRQTSKDSTVDGIGAKVGSAEHRPPALLRGEASEEADGSAIGWDRAMCSASLGERSSVATAARKGQQNATQSATGEHRCTDCRQDQRCQQTVTILVQHGSTAHHRAGGWAD